ncbi:catalase family peroxidase [Aliamphritea hakodatensis]|uniref:catalase family peroxidase n=1 Tax=Aliamphritea hakodatensis TaxID=2895352 RepID=UPI0022FD6B06|nr:catalase family peroxidase [Aliamphritea hakodatensis]
MLKQYSYLGAAVLLNVSLPVVAGSTAVKTVDAFEKVFGVTAGERRNHTKGFCFSATLSPVDNGIQQYSVSPLFTGESEVIGRLSHKGGNAKAADNVPAEYGMGLSVNLSDGTNHRMSMNTLDFFPVSTPQAFADLMVAKAQGKAAVKTFKAANPDLQRFSAHNKQKTKQLTSYEGTTYNSINSFYLVDAQGQKTAVRWSFVPVVKQGITVAQGQDFFYSNMVQNLDAGPVEWNMVVTLANPEDVVANAALPWEGEHQEVVAARLSVNAISATGACDNINYDPLILSAGFEPSEDPLLQARRDAYAVSFGRRLSEQ